MSVMCPMRSMIDRHSRACSGAKMYSNSSRRTGEPWQSKTSQSSSFFSWYGRPLSHAMFTSESVAAWASSACRAAS